MEAMTEAALLEALRAAMGAAEDCEGALTTRELCEMLGISEKTARKRIDRLQREGRVQVVHVPRKRIDGEIRPTAAYRLVA